MTPERKKRARKNSNSDRPKTHHELEEELILPAKDLPLPPHKKDWRDSYHWRIFKIMAEFVDTFQFLADFQNTVTIFGSARTKPGAKWYEEARKLGRMLVKNGYTVVTGGGPGIMEAGNRGAYEGNGESVGLNIKLPYEQRVNDFVKKSTGFHYFFVRKVALAYSAQAYVFFPGGYGTLDELFELLTLVQTHKITVKAPLVLIGRQFWTDADRWIRSMLLDQYQTIDNDDLKIYRIVDSAKEAIEIINRTQNVDRIDPTLAR